jgi:hypothetical protein
MEVETKKMEEHLYPSFDSALLTPDLLDSYNLAKNRDYRLFQSSNNPFYSLQRNPSGGINNVYTEFKKGGRVEWQEEDLCLRD